MALCMHGNSEYQLRPRHDDIWTNKKKDVSATIIAAMQIWHNLLVSYYYYYYYYYGIYIITAWVHTLILCDILESMCLLDMILGTLSLKNFVEASEATTSPQCPQCNLKVVLYHYTMS